MELQKKKHKENRGKLFLMQVQILINPSNCFTSLTYLVMHSAAASSVILVILSFLLF